MRPLMEDWTTYVLVDLFRRGRLTANPEYQRGVVWSDVQMRMFIDSVLRDYQMPLIYLRKLPIAEDGEARYEIIDGQQRINALYGFATDLPVVETKTLSKVKNVKGSFVVVKTRIPPLFDPRQKKSLFLEFLRHAECPWAGKKFSAIPETNQQDFMRYTFPVVITEGSDDETRDMFIRLQGGSALSEQEKRDSWPGDFCRKVLEIGGKLPLELSGHPFFIDLVRKKKTDRGQVRQLVAQVFMLFLLRRESGADSFSSMGADELDACYRRHSNIKDLDGEVHRFVEILGELHSLFENPKRKLKNDDVIHLVLFADMLRDDFSQKWENGVRNALETWQDRMIRARNLTKGDLANGIQPGLNLLLPAMDFIDSKGPSIEKIRERHAIFSREMLRLLGNDLQPRHPINENGDWTEGAKEAAYYLEGRRDYRNNTHKIAFIHADFQDIPGHAKGTFYENWALTRKES